jgi:replicative DNA helicase
MNISPSEFDALSLRVPPHSNEAECAVLGSLLLANQSWNSVGDLLTDADFYSTDHQIIYAAIGQLINASKTADIITVYEQLQRIGKDESVGGLAYLNALAQYVSGAGAIRRYAEIVRERAILRKLAAVGDAIVTSAFAAEGLPLSEILDKAEQSVMHIGESSQSANEGFISIDQIVVRILDDIQERADNPKDITGTATGFEHLDKMTSGFQAGDLIILAARPSMGKAQPLDAKVLRSDGSWIAMGDLRVGDGLASVDGAPSTVTGLFPQGPKNVVRVIFSDGRSTECCDEHLWLVHHRQWPAPRVLETREISRLMRKPSMAGRLWIDQVSGEFGAAGDLPLDPWVLGALLGDGCLTGNTIRFSKDAAQTLDELRERIPDEVALVAAGGCDWRISSRAHVRGKPTTNPVTLAMRDLGLMGCDSSTKFIPRVYMEADRSSRLDVMRGLLDTDGWVEKHGSVLFSSASMELANNVRELARGLGYWCSYRTKETSYTYLGEKRAGMLAHVLTISGPDTSELFLFDGKRQRCTLRERTKRVAFASIEDVGIEPCQCISVSHDSHLYVTDDHIVTHNTALAINIAEHVALNEGLPVAVFSMEMGAQQLGVRMIGSIGRIDQGRLRTGKLTDDEWPRLTEAIEKLRTVSLDIEERGALTVTEVRSASRRLARQRGKLGLIVVDYLQLMSISTGMSKENRATALGEVTRGLKNLAKELQCPVVALSQLSRAVEARSDKRPMMSDLRESGAIEQDADVIMFIYRDDYYNTDSKEPGVAELIISKQRSGPTGTVKLAFAKEITKFESMYQGGDNY